MASEQAVQIRSARAASVAPPDSSVEERSGQPARYNARAKTLGSGYLISRVSDVLT